MTTTHRPTGRRPSGPLPGWVVTHLREILTGPGDYRARYRRAAGYRDALHEAGWPLAAIATPLGISRQAVDQWGSGNPDRSDLPPVPIPPPPKPKPTPVRELPPQVPPEDVARMRELVPLAEQVNGRTAPDSPLRVAGKELAEIMARNVRAGVSINRVAVAAGQTRNAAAFRLVRYGYGDIVPQWTRDYVARQQA